MNGPSIAIGRVPVMYRLPFIGKPRTAGPGKSHRQSSGPKKGKPAGKPAEGAADNRRPLHSGGQWQCKTETLLHLEQRFVHCGDPGDGFRSSINPPFRKFSLLSTSKVHLPAWGLRCSIGVAYQSG